MLTFHHVTKLPSYQVTKLQVTQLPSTKLPSYQVTKFPSYKVTKLPSYQATKLPSYQGMKLQIYIYKVRVGEELFCLVSIFFTSEYLIIPSAIVTHKHQLSWGKLINKPKACLTQQQYIFSLNKAKQNPPCTEL